MDRAEAIKRLDLLLWLYDKEGQDKNYDAVKTAIAALREQEQSNEPLTLEELRNMSGEPVYCADYDLWGIVNIGNCGQWKGKPFIGGYSSNNVSFNYDIEMRGLTLYRHKPKEGADHE